MNTATQFSWTNWSANRFMLALYFAAYLTFLIFGEVSFTMLDGDGFVIGQASQQNADVSARVAVYFKAISLLAFALILLYRLLIRWCDRCESNYQTRVIRPITLAGTGLIVANQMGVDNSALVHAVFILSLMLLVMEWVSKFHRTSRILLNPTALIWVGATSLLETIGILFLFNSVPSIYTQGTNVFLLLFLLNSLIVTVWTSSKYSFRYLIHHGTPIAFLPILLVVVTELNIGYFNHLGSFLPYKWIGLSLFIGVCGLWVLFLKRSKLLKSSNSVLSNVYLPFVLIGMVLMAFYDPFQSPSVELFELANPANAQMRFWWFGEWPFLDYMSSHLLSEQWYGFLFHQFHGYDGSLSFMVFDVLNLILVFVLGYWFLKRTLNNSYAAWLFLLLFPFPFIFLCRPLALVLLIFLLIDKCRIRPKWYFCLYAAIGVLFSIFWRLDVGVSVLYALVVFLPVILIKEKHGPLFKNLLKSFVWVLFGLGLTVLIFGLIFNFNYLKTNFLDALNYIAGSQAHGYAVIADETSNGFFLMYLFMPFIAVLAVVFGVRQYFRSEENYAGRYAPGLAAVFLLLIYLVNMPRGLVRHGLAEGHDTFLTATFYIGMSLMVWVLVKGKLKASAFEVCFSFGLLAVVLFKVYPWPNHHQVAHSALVKSTLADLDFEFHENNETQRFHDQKPPNPFPELTTFLDNELWPNQTFYDFSNTPMMYYHLQRPVPSFFCQPLQNTITDWQQLNQLKKWNETLIPVVVYASCPRTWFDATDGVPNALRQYLLAEKIYRDYRPFGVFDGKSVWLRDPIELSQADLVIDTTVQEPQQHRYGFMAGLWADKLRAEIARNQDFVLGAKPKVAPMSNGMVRVYLSKSKELDSGCFVRLQIQSESSVAYEAKLTLMEGDAEVGSNAFMVEPDRKDYLLRISNHYLYHIHGASYFDLQLNEQDTLLNVELILDKRHANR